MGKPLRVLMVEDSEDDVLLTIRALKKGGYDPVYERVENAGAMRKALEQEAWDVILCDYKMPQFNGIEAIDLLKETGIDIPLIIVSGAIGEETAVECMRLGAHDYVIKGNLSRLVPAIERELKEAESRSRRKRAEKVLRESEAKLQAVFNSVGTGILIIDKNTQIIVEANKTAIEMTGMTEDRIIGQICHSFVCPAEVGKCPVKDLGQIVDHSERKLIHAEGHLKDILKTVYPVTINGRDCYLESFIDITDRKQAEEALRRSEENFRRSLEDSPLGVRIVTEEGETIYANRSILDIYGFDSIEELKTTPAEKRYTPESFAEYQIRREKRKQGDDAPSEYDISIARKDGEVRHLHVFRKGILWDAERQFQVLYNDITERKRAKDALREGEQQLQSIVNGSPIPTFVIGKDHKVTHWNKALEEMSRIKSEEIVGTREHWKAFYSEERPCMADLLVDEAVELVSQWYSGKYIKSLLIEGAYEATDFFPDLREGGKWLRFTAAAIRDSKGMIVAAVETLEDITENRRAEEAQRESEEKYRKLIESTRDLVYTADRKGFLTYMNPTLERTLGYTHDEWIGKTFAQIVAPECIDSVIDVFRRAMRGESIPVYEVDLIRKDGTNVSVEFNASTIYDNEGKPAGRDGIGRNITERKQAEEELRTSRSQLRALATRLQQIREEERVMIAREIHDEMGGGLTGLKMDLSWLLRKMGDADPGEERVALMDKIHTSNALIDQMIRIVRRISTDLRPSILDDLGLVTALEWQSSEFTSRTEIPHEFTTTLEYVNLEETTAVAVFRIFQEALTNVVRHSEATKVVVVLREGQMSLFGDETLVLEIRDNGKGITEEEIQNPESLGLLGMKERVLAFGGALSIRGEPGGGTALVLKIPRKQGESS
jgi:PAS domain S-box-containing protein